MVKSFIGTDDQSLKHSDCTSLVVRPIHRIVIDTLFNFSFLLLLMKTSISFSNHLGLRQCRASPALQITILKLVVESLRQLDK